MSDKPAADSEPGYCHISCRRGETKGCRLWLASSWEEGLLGGSFSFGACAGAVSIRPRPTCVHRTLLDIGHLALEDPETKATSGQACGCRRHLSTVLIEIN